MEFTELIRTAKVDNVVLQIPNKLKMTGTLCLTSHHIIFADRSNKNEELKEISFVNYLNLFVTFASHFFEISFYKSLFSIK